MNPTKLFTNFMDTFRESVETYEHYFIKQHSKDALFVNVDDFEYTEDGVHFSYEAEEYGFDSPVTVGGSVLTYEQVEAWLDFVKTLEEK